MSTDERIEGDEEERPETITKIWELGHKAWKRIGGGIYWALALGNAKTSTAYIADPREVPSPPRQPPPVGMQLDTREPGDERRSRHRKAKPEGTTYYADPFTIWFCYAEFYAGIVLLVSAVPFPPAAGTPMAVGGVALLAWSLLWFVTCTRMLPPVTLMIFQRFGTVNFRECRVTVFPKWIQKVMGFQYIEVTGHRANPIIMGDGGTADSLESYMRMTGNVRQPRATPPTPPGIDTGSTMVVVPPPLPPPAAPTDGTAGAGDAVSPSPGTTTVIEEKSAPIIPDSQVEVVFSGTLVLSIDIDRPQTVKEMFWDDYVSNPPAADASAIEDMAARINRLVLPDVYAACDPTLQQIEWHVAVSDIDYINRRLLTDLPERIGRLAIKVHSILLSDVEGEPFKQLKEQTSARLKADKEINVARTEQAAKTAQAESAAAIAEAEADRDRRANVAKENAAKESGLAKQAALRAVADAELGTQKALLLVAEQTAKISVAPLEARLKAIQTNQSSALLDTFTNLNDEGKKAVLVQMMTSLGTSSVPETIVSVANGGGIDSFPVPALLKALQEALSNFMGRPPVPPSTT